MSTRDDIDLVTHEIAWSGKHHDDAHAALDRLLVIATALAALSADEFATVIERVRQASLAAAADGPEAYWPMIDLVCVLKLVQS